MLEIFWIFFKSKEITINDSKDILLTFAIKVKNTCYSSRCRCSCCNAIGAIESITTYRTGTYEASCTHR